MDSTRSSESQTRFSTPVRDLDDHRNQPSSMPCADPASTQTIVGPDVTEDVSHGGRPALLQDLQGNEGPRDADPVSRDFKEGIISDKESGMEEDVSGHRGSIGTAIDRHGTLRRNLAQAGRSQQSSSSSRATSPANSVDAFADPRRRERANTIDSKVPPNLDPGIIRTISGGTHHRRPTFSNESLRQLNPKDDGISYHNPAEDDICFPYTDDPLNKKAHRIDYEELDEFVAASTRGRPPLPGRSRQKLSFSSHGNQPKRIFDSKTSPPSDSNIVIQSVSTSRITSEGATGDGKSVLNEKDDDPLGANGPCESHPSLVEPHRFSLFSSELEETIHATDYCDLLASGATSSYLFEHPVGKGVWWMDILDPTEQELLVFQRAFGIHRLTTEDIITQEAREKVELFKQYYFVCFRSFQMDKTRDDYMDPVNVYMVVFREGILTFTYTSSPHAAHVRKRIGKLRDYMALTADWICYAMVDDIVDTFGPVITSIELETDTIEDQVFVARSEDFTPLLRQIGDCRKKVMSLMRLLGGKADVIRGFSKRCNESYDVTPRGDIGLYLGDIQDHVVTMMSNLGHFEKMLSRSHSNYLAQLSVDQIQQGTRQNEVLSKITLLASILVPLNLVCGLFGMNVPVPGRNTEGLGWFFGILGLIVAMVVGSLVVARRYRVI